MILIDTNKKVIYVDTSLSKAIQILHQLNLKYDVKILDIKKKIRKL